MYLFLLYKGNSLENVDFSRLRGVSACMVWRRWHDFSDLSVLRTFESDFSVVDFGAIHSIQHQTTEINTNNPLLWEEIEKVPSQA